MLQPRGGKCVWRELGPVGPSVKLREHALELDHLRLHFWQPRRQTVHIEVNSKTVTEVRDRISSTLRRNNITDFDLNSIHMRKDNGEAIITVAYEKRVPLIANLDIVATFDESLR